MENWFCWTSLIFAMGSSLVLAAPAPVDERKSFSRAIQWTANCTEPGEPAIDNPLLECGTLQVPMDWTNPSGPQITLDVTRLRSNDSSARIGSLFVNPGGPGGSAGELCTIQATSHEIFSAELESHFDIICPDPRGVGKSSAVKCGVDLWKRRPPYFVDSEESFQAVLEYNKAFGQDCLDRTGPLLGFVDTTNAAKDLDALRAALGGERFNWLGFSYGTQLGAAYAELFPDRIRAMVLDGAVDHSMGELEGFVMASWALEDDLTRFFHWCDNNSTCALHSNMTSSADVWDKMIAHANEKPIPAPACVSTANTSLAGTCLDSVSGYDIIFNLENHFMDPDAWPEISEAMRQAVDGNATLLSNPIPGPSRNADVFPNLAIGCLDWASNASSYPEHIALQNLGAAMFAHTLGSGMWMQFATSCIGWPFAATNPQHWLDPATMVKTPEILIVNAEHDPATPIAWAHGLKRQIPNSVLVTRRGDGHTSYTYSEEARRVMDAYLVNGTVPPQNLIVN